MVLKMLTNFGTATSNLGQTFADGGLYGAGKFTYSTNQFSSSLVAGTVATATSASINFDSRLDPGCVKDTYNRNFINS
jgi:hypothetical protein